MFIYIKHGDNQEFLVNTNCSVILLLRYIRKKMGLLRTDTIDLCDETGTMKLLFLTKTYGDCATKFLTARNIYYICKVEHGVSTKGMKIKSSYKAIVPLLKNPEPELVEFLHIQCGFLERSQIKMIRTLEAKRLAVMESSTNLAARSSKSSAQQSPSSNSQQKSKGGRFEDRPSPTHRPFYKTRVDFLKKLH